jgi:hypothetical protein
MVHEGETTSAVSRNDVAPRATVQKMFIELDVILYVRHVRQGAERLGGHDIVPAGGGGGTRVGLGMSTSERPLRFSESHVGFPFSSSSLRSRRRSIIIITSPTAQNYPSRICLARRR